MTYPQQYPAQQYGAPAYPTPQQYAPQAAAPQQQLAASSEMDSLVMGGGDGLSAPFMKIGPATSNRPAHSAPGEWKGGKIVKIRQVHSTKRGRLDQATGKYDRTPQYYQSGKRIGQPIYDHHVIVETPERDPSIENDNGLRVLELKGLDKYWEPTADFACTNRAARLAVAKAGAQSLQVGGELYLAWVRQVPLPGVDIPAIDWVGHYVPPGDSVRFESAPAAAVAPPVAVQPPASFPPPPATSAPVASQTDKPPF